MSTRLIVRVWLVLALIVFATPSSAARQLSIVATVGMIGDTVERVAGDRVTVTTLMGTGVDPHSYRQTRSDVVRLGQADVIFVVGLYLEAQMEDLLDRLAKRQVVVALGESIDPADLLGSAVYENKYDPHIWMDVSLWRKVVEKIRVTLTELDPNGTAQYLKNAEALQMELDELERYVKGIVATIPEHRRIVVTAHDAFSYFGRAYDLEVMGIQGISTESEAGLRRIEELVDLIVDRDLTAVFVESSVSERNIRALIEGAAARGHKVSVGAKLFSDAMGAPETYEGTYIGMLDHNATRIVLALGGSAPLAGMSGKLGVD